MSTIKKDSGFGVAQIILLISIAVLVILLFLLRGLYF